MNHEQIAWRWTFGCIAVMGAAAIYGMASLAGLI